MMTAARRGNLAMVQLLVDKNANVNARDASGETALMVAAERGNAAVLKLLVQKGADPSARDLLGRTAYDTAFSAHKVEAAQFLAGTAQT